MAKIEKTKSGKYRVRVYVGKDENGKKHWKSMTHKDKKTLKYMASEYEFTNEYERQQEYKTLSDSIENYISAREAVLSPSTVRSYKCMQNTLTKSYASFCALRLDKIDSDALQYMINSLVTDGKSVKYTRNIYGLISSTIQYYALNVPRVTLPQKTKPNVYEPTQEDIKATVKAARGLRIEIPILLALHGLRRGEICALKYPDDFDGNIVHISRSKVYIGNNQNVDKAPKNYTSDRYVPLDPALVEKIKKQGFVTDYTLGALSQEFPDFLKRNGIPKYRFHDLRHFFASYLHEQGYSDAEIMLLGGWKTDSVMKRNYRYALDKSGLNKRMRNTIQKLF